MWDAKLCESPPYIIAELGVNHDGSINRALELVDSAAHAGADAVKLQYFEADRLLSRAARLAMYQKATGAQDPFELLRSLELSIKEMSQIVEHARSNTLDVIVTVFSIELVESAMTIDWDAYKIASPDLINRPLIDALRATGGPLILSTGASTIEEVQRAAQWTADVPTAFLQCVSSYPTPMEYASLGGIAAIQNLGVKNVGYSDHTQHVETGALAVQCGAGILEKHLTYNCDAAGPDHAASLDPNGFGAYVNSARSASFDQQFASTFPVEKMVLQIEQDVRAVSRQSLTTTRDLEVGHAIKSCDLTIKRPGTGIEPFKLAEVIGGTLRRAVEVDMPLTASDLARTPVTESAALL